MDNERFRRVVNEAKDMIIFVSFALFLFFYPFVHKFVELITEVFKMWREETGTASVHMLLPRPGPNDDSSSHEQSFSPESFYCTPFSPVVAYGGSYQDMHRGNLPFEEWRQFNRRGRYFRTSRLELDSVRSALFQNIRTESRDDWIPMRPFGIGRDPMNPSVLLRPVRKSKFPNFPFYNAP